MTKRRFFWLFALAAIAGGRALAQEAAPPPPPPPLPAPPPPSPDVLRAIPDVAQQKAQREAVQDIGQAQKDLKTSARDIGPDATVESIKRLQARAVRLANQAAKLQISDSIATANADVLPEIKPLLELRDKAVALRTAIQDEAQRVKDADPARDAGTVRGLIEKLEKDVAGLRDVTREADRQLDRLRAIYLSSASLVVSGGVSLGSYQAGFLHYYTQYLLTHGRYVRQFFTSENGSSLDLVGGFKLATGASAGSINAFLAAVAGCRKPVADPEKSLFFQAWIPVGMERLADSDEVKVDGILSRKPIDEAVSTISRLWSDAGERAGWDACDAYLGFSATRLHGRTLQFPEKVSDRVDDGAPAAEMIRLTEKFVLRMTGAAGTPPAFSSFRPNPRDPKAEPPAELYPTLGVSNPSQVGSLDGLPASLEQVVKLLQASSSFPFAFPPVQLPITVWKKQAAPPVPAGAAQPPPVYVGSPDPAAQMIDGGVFDNTPLGLAIRMGEWMPHAPARYLFLVSDNVAWWPYGPPRPSTDSGAKPSHPGTTIDAYKPFVSGFISASEDTELMNTVEGHGDINRELPARQMPVAGEQMAHFLAFFERDFRIFDFYMGMVDAHDHIASHDAEQLGMLERAGAKLTVSSPIYDCFLAHRRQLASITYDGIAALPACRGVSPNLIALLKASTKIRRAPPPRQAVTDSLPLQPFFDALDEFGYRFRELRYRGSEATGATAERAIRDRMQDLAHDLSSKQDGWGNQFVVSIASKAAPNLFLYRPPRFYLAVGLDTDAGGELQQGFEFGQLTLSSRPAALRLTLSERVRELDRSRLDPATDKFTYAATLMGAAHLVLELPISNVFQFEVGAGAAILERVGSRDNEPFMMWRWGPEGVLRLDLLQRFFLGASFVYYLDDCAGTNRCSHVPGALQTLPNAITSSQYKIWLSIGTRFFWFN